MLSGFKTDKGRWVNIKNGPSGNKSLKACSWCSAALSCSHSRTCLLFHCLPRDQRTRSATPLIACPSGLPSFFFFHFVFIKHPLALILMTSSELSVSSELVPEGSPVSRTVAHQYHSRAVFSCPALSPLQFCFSQGQIIADDFILITFASFPLSAASRTMHRGAKTSTIVYSY